MNAKANHRGMFILGILICCAVAAVSVALERVIPGDLLGASLSMSTIDTLVTLTALAVIFCMGLM